MLTVVTPPTQKKLTTVTRVKALAPSMASVPDATIGLLIDQASAVVETFLGRPLGLTTYREEFFGYGAGMSLTRGPVTEVVSIISRGVAVVAPDYVLDPAGTIYRAPLATWRNSRHAWNGGIVEYKSGYTMPADTGSWTLPSDIERAAILCVSAFNSSGSRDPNLRSETSDGVGSWTWATGANAMSAALPSAEAEALLTRYRAPVFA